MRWKRRCSFTLRNLELTEPLRELYVTAYSLPTTAAYLYKSMTTRLKLVFGSYMPQAQLKDFYEMEIASGSLMRGFMSVPCDLYFTIDAKVNRFLECSLKLYDIPKPQREAVITAVSKIDLHAMAADIIQKTVQQAEAGFEALSNPTAEQCMGAANRSTMPAAESKGGPL